MENRETIIAGLLEVNSAIFLQAMEGSGNGIVITDSRLPDNPIIYCNEAFEQLTGYSFQEIIGRNCRFLQGDDHHSTARALIAEAIAKGEKIGVDIKNYRKNGEAFWNHLIIAPLRDVDDNIIHFIGIQEDVTAIINAKIALEEDIANRNLQLQASEFYLDSIFETIREPLLVLDGTLRVISANNQFCKTFELKNEDIAGHPLLEISNGAWNIPALLELLRNVLPTKNPFEGFEMQHDFKGLGRKTLLLNARQVHHHGIGQDRILLAMEDVTLLRMNEQRKAEFISLASHEINTPLTSMKGYLQLLSREVTKRGDEQLKGSLEAALRSAGRLEQTTSTLLEIAKFQSGSVSKNSSQLNVDGFVEQIVNKIQPSYQNHQLVLSANSDTALNISPKHLEQLMFNLIDNAVKFSPDADQVEIAVSKKKENLEIKVTDRGIGVASEEKELIFQQFYRGANVDSKFQGLGIGLYLCKEIVDQLNGTIKVLRNEEEGTSFVVTLPINDRDDH